MKRENQMRLTRGHGVNLDIDQIERAIGSLYSYWSLRLEQEKPPRRRRVNPGGTDSNIGLL